MRLSSLPLGGGSSSSSTARSVAAVWLLLGLVGPSLAFWGRNAWQFTIYSWDTSRARCDSELIFADEQGHSEVTCQELSHKNALEEDERITTHLDLKISSLGKGCTLTFHKRDDDDCQKPGSQAYTDDDAETVSGGLLPHLFSDRRGQCLEFARRWHYFKIDCGNKAPPVPAKGPPVPAKWPRARAVPAE